MNSNKEHSKKDKWIATVCRVMLFCLSCAVILALSSYLTKGWINTWASVLAIFIAFTGALMLTILFVRWERLKLKDVGLIPGHYTIPRLFIGFTIGLVLSILQPMLLLLTGHIKLVLIAQINFATIVINLLLYIAIALREEVAFRGYPLRSLNYVIGPWVSQLIIAIIFIIEHAIGGMTWLQAILGPGLGAVLFGLAALKTNGIALPIGLHSAWNFGQWVLGFKNGAGLYKAVIEKGYETRVEHMGWISYILVMSLGIACLFFWKKDSFDLKPQNKNLV